MSAPAEFTFASSSVPIGHVTVNRCSSHCRDPYANDARPFTAGHPPSVTQSIVGGFVYRGSALPALRGKYVFGDIVDGRVFYTNEAEMVRGGGLAPLYQLRVLTATGTETSMASLAGDSRVDLRLGVDRAGELYLLAKANGRIWKVTTTRASS
jgi:hypothetical protein